VKAARRSAMTSFGSLLDLALGVAVCHVVVAA